MKCISQSFHLLDQTNVSFLENNQTEAVLEVLRHFLGLLWTGILPAHAETSVQRLVLGIFQYLEDVHDAIMVHWVVGNFVEDFPGNLRYLSSLVRTLEAPVSDEWFGVGRHLYEDDPFYRRVWV
jgi:hypothetical protein